MWRALFATEEVVSRASCWEVFRSSVDASPAPDPSTKLMHWDLQTYLPGLFQQDDRMSMANSLESRVPLADPRLVTFAFQCGIDLKLRDGATKWLLRQAVADVVPEAVLNRRKVGFDTPTDSWMHDQHRDFVRDTLHAKRAQERGLWSRAGLARLTDGRRDPETTGTLWKALCIETWARTFLDGAALPTANERPTRAPELSAVVPEPAHRSSLRAAVQEVRELGLDGTLFRAGWELKQRSGLMPLLENRVRNEHVPAVNLLRRFSAPEEVARAVRDRIPKENLRELENQARESIQGRLLCFSKWTADFGNPIDWHLNPTNGRRWSPELHWSRALGQESQVGDVKFTWEVGRFPQAYLLARAAAFNPQLYDEAGAAFAQQVRGFIAANPFRKGIHWNSGQEIVIRGLAWAFAASALREQRDVKSVLPAISEHLVLALRHVEEHRAYAEKAVHNNHLIFEALGNLLAPVLWPNHPDAARQRDDALTWLNREADEQFYRDGGYIQQSHTYHRAALHAYLWALVLAGELRFEVPAPWRAALERSVDFLVAQQNPVDGRLPNYGANDGTLPAVLHTCDYVDFRPVLQMASWAVRGERLYPPGPWDEALAWFGGTEALDAPLRSPERRTRSFATSGHHALRGDEPSSFNTFRCGTLLDRFSQIDMLHVDVFWRGMNVLVDGGSYRYNASERWHAHFLRTASHNTISVDGLDQMLHHRRFKTLYWTKAELLRFEDQPRWSLAEGRHFGYQRGQGQAIHRRAVIFAKDDLWVIVDRVEGEGQHYVRLHWLAGDFPYSYEPNAAQLTLTTPKGPFTVTTLDARGEALAGDVACGQNEPPRGWESRYYGYKKAVPSLAVERSEMLPAVRVSILSAGVPKVAVQGQHWTVTAGSALHFNLRDGVVEDIAIEEAPKRS